MPKVRYDIIMLDFFALHPKPPQQTTQCVTFRSHQGYYGGVNHCFACNLPSREALIIVYIGGLGNSIELNR